MAVYCTYEGKRKTPRCCSSSHVRRLTGVQGRFLALLEMTIWGKAVLSYRKSSSWGSGILPPSHGRRCPKGAEVGSYREMKAGIGFTELLPAEQPLREGARQRRRMDPRGGLKTNVKLSISPACHPERSRETVVIRCQGLTLSPHVPRTSPLSSAVFHTACTLSAPTGHLPLGKR